MSKRRRFKKEKTYGFRAICLFVRKFEKSKSGIAIYLNKFFLIFVVRDKHQIPN